MDKKLSLLDLYCREYGLSYLVSSWYDDGKEYCYISRPSSKRYISRVYKKRLEDMSKSEIESFVIKCAIEGIAQ